MTGPELLAIKNLKVHFSAPQGRLTVVDGVSFSVGPGDIVGIVGESGCGKSVMAQSILRLLEHSEDVEYEGEINFENRNLLSLPLSQMRFLRGNAISMIFQDPLTSLNPVHTLGAQLFEALKTHKTLSKREVKQRALELLRQVGMPWGERRLRVYPHELSGGMQQRAMIAIALAGRPRLLIADEPTTALDTTIQAQILELITELNNSNMAVLFISHDLGVISEICTAVKVMYLGQIVEEAPAEEFFKNPLHPYSRGLLKSIPPLEGGTAGDLPTIPGTVPSPADIPRGCRFSTRCPSVLGRCRTEEPPVQRAGPERRLKCWLNHNEQSHNEQPRSE